MSESSVESESTVESVLADAPPVYAWWQRSFVLQVAGITLLIAGAVYGFASWQAGSAELALPWLQGQRLLFAPTNIVLGKVSRSTVVERQIRVANLSSQPLTLLGSQRSCGCISLDEFPIVIPAGSQHHLQMKVGISKKPGPFEHSIKFFSNEAGYSQVVVTITGFVP